MPDRLFRGPNPATVQRRTERRNAEIVQWALAHISAELFSNEDIVGIQNLIWGHYPRLLENQVKAYAQSALRRFKTRPNRPQNRP